MPAKITTNIAASSPQTAVAPIAKARGPGIALTALDLVDAILSHYAGLDAIVAAAPSQKKAAAPSASGANPSPSAAAASPLATPDKETLLWHIRSYCYTAATIPRLANANIVVPTCTAASDKAVASLDLTNIISAIDDLLRRTSQSDIPTPAPPPSNNSTSTTASTSAAAAPCASSSSSSGGGGSTSKAASVSPALSAKGAPAQKRPRDIDALPAASAGSGDAETAARLADPSNTAAADPNTTFTCAGHKPAAPLPLEPSRRSIFDVSTLYDYTGFMAWRSRNTLSQHSLMQAALMAPCASIHRADGGSGDAPLSSPTCKLPPTLLSPTAHLIANSNGSTETAVFFERCKEMLTPAQNNNSNNNTKNTAETAGTSAGDHQQFAGPIPFADDGEFVSFFELLCYAHFSSLIINNVSAPSVLYGDVTRVCDKVGITTRVLTTCANAATALLQLVAASRLAASADRPPRLVRMCASFGLTQRESCAMTYVLAVHSGALINNTVPNPLTLATISKLATLDPKGLQRFLQSDRSHVRQGVVQATDQMMAKLTPDMRVLMPLEVVSSLVGADIPEEELVKLENTCLWNVLQAERNANYGVIATKAGKKTSAAAAYLASVGTGSSKKKVTFGNNKLMAALGDLIEGATAAATTASTASAESAAGLGDAAETASNASSSSSGDGDLESGADTPRTHALAGASEYEVETASNDDATSCKTARDASLSSAPTDSPYGNDIEYLDDNFRVLAMMIKARNSEGDMKDEDEFYYATPKTKVEAQLREFAGKQRVLQKKVETRMAATRSSGAWVPRAERVAERLRLSEFEKQLLMLMVGNVVSHDILVAINGRSFMRDGARELTVGYILFVLCASLPERVACRKCFFDSSPLIANGLISISVGTPQRSRFNTDLMEYLVEIDRSIVDYLMGTDIEPDEMVQGSRLYTPDVALAHVALPSSVKGSVLSTIEHYSLFSKCKEHCGFGKGLGTGGSGLVFLFHGPSGTGKTMLANAVAHDLNKKILLVNLQQYRGDSKAPDILRYVFREAKLNDAIIFFDECESFFENRDNNSVVTAVLAEFERYSGMIILATNRAQVIDEAMNRRISLMIEFKLPDNQLREQIWRTHLPANLPIAPDVSIQQLALDYELSGGLIRNAVLAAMSSAVGREQSETPTLTMEDLRHGAKQQLRGFFQAHEAASQEYLTPLRSLDEVIVDRATKDAITSIAKIAKARNTLFSQWGFNEKEYDDQGDVSLFYGPSGTGKSLAAEGIAYECSCTIRLCNVAEMFVTNTFNIQAVFVEARKLGAIIVFDQAQGLFDYSEQAAKIAQLIQYHAVRYPRPVIVLATTSPTGVSVIDTRASRICFNSEVLFQLPTKALRKELWRRSLPGQVPLADNINFDALASEQLSAKAIRSICFAACCKAALLPAGKQTVSAGLIAEVQEEFLSRERRRNTHSSMFT